MVARRLAAVAAPVRENGGIMAKDSISAADDKPVSPSIGHMVQQVTDALLLLDYAVGSGAKTADGLPIPQDSVSHIETMAAKLGLLEDGTAAGGRHDVASDDWVAFELGYYDLATALSPVTAETLRNTQVRPRGQRTWCDVFCGASPAIRFTRQLWAWSIGFMAFIILSTWYLYVMAVVGDTRTYLTSRVILELLTPWAYGGLGACVYLLRSAHIYIAARSFDVHRKPEYYNRILLGVMAGGAILLFVDHLTNDEGQIVQLSSAALGFLAGYNTDFLFKAIERVTAAILPKVGIDTVQKAGPATTPVDINDLAQRMDKAKGADKEFYKSLLAQLTGARSQPKK
jgi:hypothetical protein